MKYWVIVKNTWDEMVMYRLNFTMWRIRTILQLLTIYFLWSSLIPEGGKLFGYTQSLMLTYILGTAFLSSIILSTRTHEIGENINTGNLSIFLIRPINYFSYWFSRDLGDKLMNISFSIFELSILFFILKPPIFIQTNPFFLLGTFIAIILAVFLYFFIGSSLGLIGFWSSEVWSIRFIFFILISFFAGGLFPLDILPPNIFQIAQFLPFTYLLYFPLKVYLGQLTPTEVFLGFSMAIFWIIGVYLILNYFWNRGLKIYTAYGR